MHTWKRLRAMNLVVNMYLPQLDYAREMSLILYMIDPIEYRQAFMNPEK